MRCWWYVDSCGVLLSSVTNISAFNKLSQPGINLLKIHHQTRTQAVSECRLEMN